MRCPSCDHLKSRVLETIRVRDGLRRRRICESCASRFDTLERIEIWDQEQHCYVLPEQPAPAPLVAVPDPQPAAAKRASNRRWHPEAAPVGVCSEAAPLLLEWWNESRRSKHGANATWTETAWLASVNRVAKLPPDRQVELCAAGVEHGWQALKLEYLEGQGRSRVQPLPTAQGRPMPKDPAMLAALEQWPNQPA